MSELHNQKARTILDKIKYATLSTVTQEGKPWNSPVAHELDEDFNFYWFSDKENQHSKNVRANPYVFIVVYDSTAPEGEGEGVYVEAEVEELSDAGEINRIRNQKKQKIVDDAGEFLGNAIRRCYKATPKKFWINDAEEKDGVFLRDYRIEVKIT